MKYLLALSLVILFACKNNSPTTDQKSGQTGTTSESDKKTMETAMQDSIKMVEQQAKDNKTNTAKPDSIYRLVILFYSVASGVETQLINEYIDSVGFYSQDHGKKIDYSLVHWGREGETDIAMRLNELSESQQNDFIGMTRRVLAKGKYVNIYENYPWHRKGK